MANHNAPTVVPPSGADTYRASTDAAGLCGAIVKQTAMSIQGRKYVRAEGWQAIAIAHGCTASARGVERVEGGVRAIGEVRRMDTGAVIAEAEGFVGEDEPVWFGGVLRGKKYEKRPDFAIRAMTQTRAISRACRSAFAHVVVMIDKSLGTTPAEEMQGVYDHEPGGGPEMHAQNDALTEAAREITEITGETRSTYQIDKEKKAAAKAKDWTDKAITNLNLADHTNDSVSAFWNENRKQIEWLAEHAPDQHERLVTACDAARERASAKAA